MGGTSGNWGLGESRSHGLSPRLHLPFVRIKVTSPWWLPPPADSPAVSPSSFRLLLLASGLCLLSASPPLGLVLRERSPSLKNTYRMALREVQEHNNTSSMIETRTAVALGGREAHLARENFLLVLKSLAVSHGMWDLGSPTRDRTCAPHIGNSES